MVHDLPLEQFGAWCLAQQAEPVVLDVREPWELQTASVRAQGFEVHALAMGELVSRWHELPRDRPIACLCHHGMRSLQAARYLQQQGFDPVVNLQGGIDAWSALIDPGVPRY
ncbi:MAG: rhodanese-like domain-containing protein [Betaproteobacteria bacterium]